LQSLYQRLKKVAIAAPAKRPNIPKPQKKPISRPEVKPAKKAEIKGTCIKTGNAKISTASQNYDTRFVKTAHR
jgi:hypothetical protein